jgi:O-acetyl-ADP-ribose deacetylase (regulator of RNase III)
MTFIRPDYIIFNLNIPDFITLKFPIIVSVAVWETSVKQRGLDLVDFDKVGLQLRNSCSEQTSLIET